MLGFALALAVLAQAPTPPPPPAPAALKPLGFYSQRFDYRWDTMIPLKVEVDGLQLESIFFNRREIARGPFKGADFGARAQQVVDVLEGLVGGGGFRRRVWVATLVDESVYFQSKSSCGGEHELPQSRGSGT